MERARGTCLSSIIIIYLFLSRSVCVCTRTCVSPFHCKSKQERVRPCPCPCPCTHTHACAKPPKPKTRATDAQPTRNRRATDKAACYCTSQMAGYSFRARLIQGDKAEGVKKGGPKRGKTCSSLLAVAAVVVAASPPAVVVAAARVCCRLGVSLGCRETQHAVLGLGRHCWCLLWC